MVYVQTAKDVSCTIEGDRIVFEESTGNYIVYKGTEITGIFDIGTIQFMYKTRRKAENTN